MRQRQKGGEEDDNDETRLLLEETANLTHIGGFQCPAGLEIHIYLLLPADEGPFISQNCYYKKDNLQ